MSPFQRGIQTIAPLVIQHPAHGKMYFNDIGLAKYFIDKMSSPSQRVADRSPDEAPIIEDSGSSTETPLSFRSFSEPNPFDLPASHQPVVFPAPPRPFRPEDLANEGRLDTHVCQTFEISTPPGPSLPEDPVTVPTPPGPSLPEDPVTVRQSVPPLLLEEIAVLKRSWANVGLKKQSQFCTICDNELGPDDPMPCFPEADNSRECMRCLMEYEQEMFEEHALASSDG